MRYNFARKKKETIKKHLLCTCKVSGERRALKSLKKQTFPNIKKMPGPLLIPQERNRN